MFDIEICEARRVILYRFTGSLGPDDFAALDRLAGEARGGPAFDCIFDLTRVEKADLAAQYVAGRGELPQTFKDRQRIYVVPQDDLKLLVRLYAAYQANKGWRPPDVVRTLAEALAIVGLKEDDFRFWRSRDG